MFILTIIHAPTTFILYVSLFLSSPALAAAQPEFEQRSNPLYFGYSLAIATAMAGMIFILLKKFCKPIHMVQGQDIEEPDHRASVGLDPYVLETFPVFKYSDVVAHRAGIGPLECSVCLSSFEVDDDDKDGELLLVLLPKCNHVFHIGCVDPWFKGHTTCPLCRTDLVPKSDELTTSQPESSQVPELGGREGVVEVNGSDDNDLEVRGDIEEGQFWKYRRWKSTGDVTEVKSEEEDDCWKRFTLKLPEEKMMELGEKSGEFRRASSI